MNKVKLLSLSFSRLFTAKSPSYYDSHIEHFRHGVTTEQRFIGLFVYLPLVPVYNPLGDFHGTNHFIIHFRLMAP